MRDTRTTMRGGKVIDNLKHTSRHFAELMPEHYWKSTSPKKEKKKQVKTE